MLSKVFSELSLKEWVKRGVLIAMLCIPFVFTTQTADQHFTIGWFFLSIVVTSGLILNLFQVERKRFLSGIAVVLGSLILFWDKGFSECFTFSFTCLISGN